MCKVSSTQTIQELQLEELLVLVENTPIYSILLQNNTYLYIKQT